jgi:RecA-family ATPase
MALSLDDFRNRKAEEMDWIVPGLLTRGNTGFIMGQPKKAAKSWLLLAMAWDLSEGKPVWSIPAFKPPRPMRTVYFTQEDTEDNIHERIQAHFSTGRKPNDGLWVVPKNLNIKLDTATGRNIVQGEIDYVRDKVGQIDLVMFDPMRRIHGGDENDSEVIAGIWDVIDRIHQRYKCATMISHHITKPPKDREGYDPTDPYNGRGSGDIYGGGDAFVVVVPGRLGPEGAWRRVGAYFESKRGQQLAPASLKVMFKTGQIAYLGEESRGEEEEKEVPLVQCQI